MYFVLCYKVAEDYLSTLIYPDQFAIHEASCRSATLFLHCRNKKMILHLCRNKHLASDRNSKHEELPVAGVVLSSAAIDYSCN